MQRQGREPSRVLVKIPKTGRKNTSTADPRRPLEGMPGRDTRRIAVAFSFDFSEKKRNDNTTTKSLILAQDER